ncbi:MULTISPECIES: hypothetical protein [Sphingomonadaceae]|uniref:Core-binding (CB) domain-containing protein n=1 Tax=Novosphingobium soli TaxID=574956 RepID=A0ABV6CWE1_9SPHN|nr:hypothetical protein [Sphingobium sp. YG1]BBD02120.1 hypothetical protein YGS_C2P0133 [Sphingobium sp. YG1]
MFLAQAFAGQYAAAAAVTRRAQWYSIATFARFAAGDANLSSVTDLTTEMVGRYMLWLDRQRSASGNPWSEAYKGNMLTSLRQLVEWTRRNRPDRLPCRIDFTRGSYDIHSSKPRRRLTASELKAILAHCYEEIDEAWRMFSIGQQALATTGELAGIDPRLVDAIRKLAHVDDGIVPGRRKMELSGVPWSTVRRHGGLQKVAPYLHLTGEAAVAFYIAIIIQTAGNPDPIRLISRDCLTPHPLDGNRVMVEWDKPRAGRKLKRAQRRSFDTRRAYAAPNLINRLLQMTASLVQRARPQDREKLFLLLSGQTGAVTVVPNPTLWRGVKLFVDRRNAIVAATSADERRLPLLPNMAPAFLRGSVATEYYRASGGDIVTTQAQLNHASVTTTDRYVRGPETEKIQQEAIAEVQALLIAWVTGAEPPKSKPRRRPGRSTVPFSHDCLDPANGACNGTLCPHYGACLRCPGLVIPLDIDHLARILQAIAALVDARDRIDPVRWEEIYGSSYRILFNDILPDFPTGLRTEAEKLVSALPPLPVLE